MAVPAAPAPLMTIFMSAGSLPTTLAALMRAARGGKRTNVSKAKHGSAIGNHSDTVALNREIQPLARIRGDSLTGSGYPWSISDGKIIGSLQRKLTRDGDYTTKLFVDDKGSLRMV
jgi:hypothetical protein